VELSGLKSLIFKITERRIIFKGIFCCR